MQPAYVVDGVGGAAYDEAFAQHAPRFGHGHVAASEVNTVGLDGLDEFHAVVYHEHRPFLAATGEQAAGYGLNLGIGGAFHAQLYPSATAAQGEQGRLFVGDFVRLMGDELYGNHSSFLIIYKCVADSCGLCR